MAFNWFTVIAQIINFLILLFILRLVLYKPIFRFMKERRDNIAKKVKDAEMKIKEGEDRKKEYDEKIEEFEKDKQKRRAEFLYDMAERKQESLAKLKKDVEKEKSKIDKQLITHREKIIDNVNKIISQKFVKFVENVFGSLSSNSIEEKMLELFVTKLKTSNKKTIFDFNRVITKNKGVVDIFTAFELHKKSKKSLEDALADMKIKFKKIKFNIKPELMVGVELKVDNSYITWNIKEILEGLETELLV